ncbi:MAG: AmmeMemoRadiSam system protein B [Planctomycetes bacterium]|nr:AmmeMemoRadiSam system protein B [Planctomycetota bacterium]
MEIRNPVVAGQFYSGSNKGCLAELHQCIDDGGSFIHDLPHSIAGGIVPHAGWTFSGDLAGAVFSAIKRIDRDIDTFVIFGAVHCYMGRSPAVYDRGSWKTPVGTIEIDSDLAGDIVAGSAGISDLDVHGGEHSIEVQVPFIQEIFPEAKIVPVMVPPCSEAVEFGADVGKIIAGTPEKRVVCIASSDLTHYGPRYGFYPAGAGQDGIRWAKEVNDAGFINLALEMKAAELLAHGKEKNSACGAGAVAALVAAVKQLGADTPVLLGHTHSNEVMVHKYGQSSEESVGYAGIVF